MTVLVTADGYRFGGKDHDKSDDIAALRSGVADAQAAVLVARLGQARADWIDWASASTGGSN